jgi:hypothetical protein
VIGKGAHGLGEPRPTYRPMVEGARVPDVAACPRTPNARVAPVAAIVAAAHAADVEIRMFAEGVQEDAVLTRLDGLSSEISRISDRVRCSHDLMALDAREYLAVGAHLEADLLGAHLRRSR